MSAKNILSIKLITVD